MLYLLEDSSLDRGAFEARLVDNERLGEILAEAVELLHAMRQSGSEGMTPVYLDASSVRTYADHCVKRDGSEAVSRSWLGLAVFAASILVVGFLGWQSFRAFLPSSISIDSDFAEARQNVPRSSGGAESFKKVVWAWGEVGTGHHEELLTQYASLVDSEVALASCDSVCDNDVPEWLVLATKAILDQDGGVDLPFEDVDSRTLIQ
jgi:hypothetical protein